MSEVISTTNPDGGSSHPPQALPWFGTRPDQREALLGTLLAVVVTLAYVGVAGALGTPTTWIEGVSVAASLACVWLARTENIWSMPTGIVAVILMGWFFLNVGLVGQGWLQLAFYVPVQLIGWWAWARGGKDRTELRVSHLSVPGWAGATSLTVLLWLLCWVVFARLYDESLLLGWDTSVVGASIVAQLLMTVKKRECWLWWIVPVNISAIGLYAATGAWAFVFLYVVFLANAFWGAVHWHRASLSS